jgi:hypothetical protein
VQSFRITNSRFVNMILAMTLIVTGLGLSNVDAASATGGTVSAPAAPTLAKSTANQDPGDFVLGGFGASDTLLVSVGFVNPPAGTSFSIPTTTGLTRSYGYSSWTGLTQISFTGTLANANAALAALTVSTGATAGDVTIKVSATINPVGLVYNPINEHFYEYVASSAISYASARTAAAAKSYDTVGGYLVTITDSQENTFVKDNVNNAGSAALNVWIAAADSVVEGDWRWDAGPENGQSFWRADCYASGCSDTTIYSSSGSVVASKYASWASGEPNNWGGSEDYAVTNWTTADGLWNDLGSTSNNIQGYVVEYSAGTWGGNTYSFASRASAQVTAQVNSFATNVSATVGNAQSVVSWTAPSAGTVSSYTAKATPAGGGTEKTCNTTATNCIITGLTNGVAYTYTVFTDFTTGADSTSAASAAVTPVDSSPGLTGPSSASLTVGTAASLGDFTVTDPFVCGWNTMTATVSIPDGKGTLTATASGSATISGSGTRTLTITGTMSELNTVLDTVAVSASVSGSVDVTTNVVPAIRFTSGGVTYHLNKSNGHYYSVIETLRSWNDAQTDAKSRTFCGSKGYLAAIDNAAEQEFIESEALNRTNNLWVSGFKTAGLWQWQTGSNAGDSNLLTAFDQGLAAGSGPWQNGEPNNSGDYMHLWYNNGAYGWDDTTGATTQMYLVEYGSNSSFTAPTKVTSLTVAATSPGAPTITSITAGNGQLSVAFTAGNAGGGTIAGYQYTLDGGTTWSTTSGSPSSPLVITGLDNGTPQSVKIRADNGTTGAWSNAMSGTPVGPAGTPTINSSSAVNGQLSIPFTAPLTNGGAAITGYKYSLDNGSTWSSLISTTTGPIVITGLTNGQTYQVKIRAVNSYGDGSPSTAVSLTPVALTVPGAPTMKSATVTGTDLEIELDWDAPTDDGGAAISDYVIEYSSDSGANWSTYDDGVSTATQADVLGLSRTATFVFKVKAVNSVGSSLYSGLSDKIKRGQKPASLPLTAPTLSFTLPTNSAITAVNSTLVGAKVVNPPAGIPSVEVIRDLTSATGAGLKVTDAAVIETGSQARAAINIDAALAANKVAAGFIRIGSNNWVYLGNKSLVQNADGSYTASTDAMAFAAPTAAGAEYILVVAVVDSSFGEADFLNFASLSSQMLQRARVLPFSPLAPQPIAPTTLRPAAVSNANVTTLGYANIVMTVAVTGTETSTVDPNAGGGGGTQPTPTPTPTPTPSPTVTPTPQPTNSGTPSPNSGDGSESVDSGNGSSGSGSGTGAGSGSGEGTSTEEPNTTDGQTPASPETPEGEPQAEGNTPGNSGVLGAITGVVGASAVAVIVVFVAAVALAIVLAGRKRKRNQVVRTDFEESDQK